MDEDSNEQQFEEKDSGLVVSKVVLSKNGVGYFERRGKVEGQTSVELFFKTADMNDVLKSLTMIDRSQGGLVSSISYESTKPLEEQLHEISLSLNNNSTLVDLLAQLKGTSVQIEVKSKTEEQKAQTVQGVVIGLESTETTELASGQRHSLNLLVSGSAVQFFDLTQVTKLKLKNEIVQNELKHLLRTLLQSKKKDLKSVTAYTQGSGIRDIQASYIVEAPVWKTSYRLLLNDEGKSLFQGWALVDNDGNEDWRRVELSLVTGQANSFVYDLYNPRFVKRSEVHVEEEESLAPPVLEDKVAVHNASGLDSIVANAIEEQNKPTRDRSMENAEEDEDEESLDNFNVSEKEQEKSN